MIMTRIAVRAVDEHGWQTWQAGWQQEGEKKTPYAILNKSRFESFRNSP